ncbi:MAG: tandem-95 repeat protein [Ignavibacteriales bacterium]|nr:MAG: tandem-95 repeat protein [Ignavibacteriales bacterium]
MKRINSLSFIIAIILIASKISYAQVTLTLPTAVGTPGSEVMVPITVNDLTGLNISSYQFQINYNPAVINITEASFVGTISEGGSPNNYFDNVNGRFYPSWLRAANQSGPRPLVGSGVLLYFKIKFMAAGNTTITYGSTGGYISEFVGTSSFTITSNTGSATTSLVNNPPVFDPVPAKTVNEGSLLTFTVNAIDPEGQTVTYSTGTLPTGATFNPSTKTFSWTPTYDQAGSYTVDFRASDGNSTTTLTVNITVVNVNRAPTLNLNPTSPYNVNGGQLLQIALVGSDPDGNTLTYSYTSTPAMTGAVLNSSTGAFSWTPTSSQAGTYNVTFSVTDGSLSATAAAVITVINVNVAPTLTLTPVSPFNVYATQTLNIQLNGADANIGDILTYSFTTTPSITGATINSSTGAFTWTPSLSQKGSYTVTFKVTDNGGLFATSVGVINVNNAAPTLVLNPVGPSFNVNEGSALTIQLVGSDINVGDILTYSFTSTPAATGAIINPSTGVFSWTPATNQFGTYNVTFTVSDGSLSANVVATITVIKVNIAPTLSLNPAGPLSINEGSQLNIQLLGADVNSGTTLIYSYTATPAVTGATINTSTGAFSWTPVTNQFGTYNVIFTVSDGSLSANISTVITVIKVNIPPTLTLNPAGPFTVNEGAQLNIQLVGADVNSGTTLTYFYNSIPAATGASFNLTTGLFSWTPDYDQAGIYNVTFTVFDGAYSTNVTAVITVADVNVAPTFTLPVANTLTLAEAATTGNTVVFAASGTAGITYTMVPNTPALTWAAFNPATATLTLTPGYGVARAVTGGIYTITIRATGTNLLTKDFVFRVTVTTTLRNPDWASTGAQTNTEITINHNQPVVILNYKAIDLDDHVITYSMLSITPTTTAAIFTNEAGLSLGKLAFTPTSADAGITYMVVAKALCTAGLFSTTQTTIIVNPNRAPTFVAPLLTSQTVPVVKVYGVTQAFTFQLAATDLDSDPYTFTLVSGLGTISATGLYSWTPTVGVVNTIIVRLSDAVNPATFTDLTVVLTAASTITGVQYSDAIPDTYKLLQNFPNPFNPTTNIVFGLPKESNVTLRVFNILGQEVATLVNKVMPAGYHSVEFNASNLTSGLYIYRVEADNFVQVKKMLLMK